MLAKTHLYGGICAGALFSYICKVPINTMAVVTIAGAAGGLIPDLDHRKSKITKRTGIFGFFSSHIFKHRGILHTPFIYVVMSGMLWVALRDNNLINYMLLGLFWGEMSHLFLDMLNPTGIPLLWPVTKKKISLLPIQTGGFIDHIFGKLCLLTAVVMIAARVFNF